MIKSIFQYPYNSQCRVSDLLCNHYDLLLVIMRFGIPLGFGDDTIEEVCTKHKVHCPTMLAVINLLTSPEQTLSDEELEQISASALIQHLQRSHHYFLDYKLPMVRQQLSLAIEGETESIVPLIFHFFDEYVGEVHKHMGYEDKVVFPYVAALENKEDTHAYRIDIFNKRHDKIENKITELKNILIKYYPDGTGYALASVLHEIFETEQDLGLHNHIENHLFIPLIQYLEKQSEASEKA